MGLPPAFHPPFKQGASLVRSRWQVLVSVTALSTAFLALEAVASTVSYGRITAVRQVNIQNQGAQSAGTLVGSWSRRVPTRSSIAPSDACACCAVTDAVRADAEGAVATAGVQSLILPMQSRFAQ
jgi:outer membrane lipoprotein SlyB